MKTLVFLLLVVVAAGQAFAEELSVAGLVEASANVQMKAKASGTIGRIKVNEGDKVKEGIIIAELENKREKAFIELARAKIKSARMAIDERKIALESSRKELERKEMMKSVIARKELEIAQDHVLQYEAGVLLKENELQEAQAELNLRKAELENTYLRAPFDGVVTAIHVEEGETVRALEDPICDVFSLEKMFVKVAIPVGFIKFIDQKTAVSVQVEKEIDLSGKRLKGKVQYINPTVEPTSRTFGARLEILEPDRLVRPGMRANVIFELPEGALPPPTALKY
ncbi:MAG: efflux RND transporter periplasmic adaptor subunit [Deltaproteobacteria bacterium]|nr:efflux RND transporter periplasmic adaptor subunit [Deltaproteobacteria bacterium]